MTLMTKATVTAREVAERAGVSVPSAIQVLGSRGHLYRPETRERILAAARELGYQPNGSAKAMRAGKFDCVALVMARTARPSIIPAGFLDRLQTTLEENSKHLALANIDIDSDDRPPATAPKVLRERLVDGFVLYVNWAGRVMKQIEDLSAPAVWANHAREFNAVYSDEFAAAVDATRLLVNLGHRRIAFVRPHDWSDREVVDREAGYRHAIAEAGLQPRIHLQHYTPWDLARVVDRWEHARSHIGEWLQGADRPTAVLAALSGDAIRVQAVAMQAGLQLGTELSLLGFGDFVINAGGLPISTMYLGTSQMGIDAAEMLLARIKSPASRLPSKVHQYRFVPGATTGAPSKP